MKTGLLLITLALSLGRSPLGWAQEEESYPSPSTDDSEKPKHDREGEDRKPMTLADAQANFQTVVEIFVSQRSPKGYWPLKDKVAGTILKLKLLGVDSKTVRSMSRDGYYAARANLLDTENGRKISAEFSVDFSGINWQVKGMKMLTPATPAKRKRPKP